MRQDNRWEDIDKAALYNALLRMHKCPNRSCERDLEPVALCEDVWGCKHCKETWYIEREGGAK